MALNGNSYQEHLGEFKGIRVAKNNGFGNPCFCLRIANCTIQNDRKPGIVRISATRSTKFSRMATEIAENRFRIANPKCNLSDDSFRTTFLVGILSSLILGPSRGATTKKSSRISEEKGLSRQLLRIWAASSLISEERPFVLTS